jgi:hypothetical protein
VRRRTGGGQAVARRRGRLSDHPRTEGVERA